MKPESYRVQQRQVSCKNCSCHLPHLKKIEPNEAVSHYCTKNHMAGDAWTTPIIEVNKVDVGLGICDKWSADVIRRAKK